jgi:hypothetical protein
VDPGNSARPVPEFRYVPARPDFAESEVAQRAWELYQRVAAWRIAARALPEEVLTGLPTVLHSVLVSISESGYTVQLCAESEAGPAVVYDVEISPGPSPTLSVSHQSAPHPLSGEDLVRFRAQAAWISALGGIQICAPSLVIAIKDNARQHWLSYVVPMPDEAGFVQMGGFHVLEVDESGVAVVGRRQDSDPCGGWSLPSDGVAIAIAEEKPRTLDVGDVYTSLFWGVVLYFSNTENDRILAVDDGGISDVTEKFRSEMK